jgi:uncharacterized protein (TIGR02145 family)
MCKIIFQSRHSDYENRLLNRIEMRILHSIPRRNGWFLSGSHGKKLHTPKFVIHWLFIITALPLFHRQMAAQNIVVSFQAETGHTAIDSIRVTHPGSNRSVLLTGGESLELLNTATNTSALPLDGNTGTLYPVPCGEQAILRFYTAVKGEAVITVSNLSGQMLKQMAFILKPGDHTFNLNFPGSGIYQVNIHTDGRRESYKAVCIQGITGRCDISYTGSSYGGKITANVSVKNSTLNNTMDFRDGDILHYAIYSGKNCTVITDSPAHTKTYAVGFYECRDAQNRHYKTVKIGEQVWMAENLAWLPAVVSPPASSLSEPYYYVYGNYSNSLNIALSTVSYKNYGVLYNWPAAMNGAAGSSANPSGVQGACPAGWHLPSDAEWAQLENYLADNGYNYDGSSGGGRNKIAMSLAAQTNWNAYDGKGTVGDDLSANNRSGFSALPGGFLDDYQTFGYLGFGGYWWTSTAGEEGKAWYRYIGYFAEYMYRDEYKKLYGFSIRCVRNSTSEP